MSLRDAMLMLCDAIPPFGDSTLHSTPLLPMLQDKDKLLADDDQTRRTNAENNATRHAPQLVVPLACLSPRSKAAKRHHRYRSSRRADGPTASSSTRLVLLQLATSRAGRGNGAARCVSRPSLTASLAHFPHALAVAHLEPHRVHSVSCMQVAR